MWVYNNFNNRVLETGVSKAHIGRKIGKDSAYIRDHEKKGFTDEQIVTIAQCLWTTVEYLTGETDNSELPTLDTLTAEERKLIRLYRSTATVGRELLLDNADTYQHKFPLSEKNNADTGSVSA